MAARYHINFNGNAGKCTASEYRCPFGGDDKHYGTAKEARSAFEDAGIELLNGLKKDVFNSPLEQLKDRNFSSNELDKIFNKYPVNSAPAGFQSKYNLQLLIGLGTHPNSSSDLLEKIYNTTDDFEVHAQIAQNPKTPEKVLRKIFEENKEETASGKPSKSSILVTSMGMNPSCPDDILEGISHFGGKVSALYSVAINPKATPDQLKRIARKAPNVYKSWVLESPNINLDVIDDMLKAENNSQKLIKKLNELREEKLK